MDGADLIAAVSVEAFLAPALEVKSEKITVARAYGNYAVGDHIAAENGISALVGHEGLFQARLQIEHFDGFVGTSGNDVPGLRHG